MAFEVITSQKFAIAIETACHHYINRHTSGGSSSSSSNCSTSFFCRHSDDGINRARIILAYTKGGTLDVLLHLLQRIFISSGNWDEKGSLKPILLNALIKQLGSPESGSGELSKLSKKAKANYYLKKLSEYLGIRLCASPEKLPTRLNIEAAISRSKNKIERYLSDNTPDSLNIGVLLILDELDLLNTESLRLLGSWWKEEEVCYAIASLNQESLLNYANLTNICAFSRSYVLQETAYIFLRENDLFTKEEEYAIIDSFCGWLSKGSRDSLNFPMAIAGLHHQKLLTQDNINFFRSSSFRYIISSTANIYRFTPSLLTQSNFNALCQWAEYLNNKSRELRIWPSTMFNFLDFLIQFVAPNLTQTLLDQIMPYPAVFTHQVFIDALYHFPLQLVIERLDTWIGLCAEYLDEPAMAANAIAVDIRRTIDLCREGHNRAFANSQNTHVISVHASISQSAHKLRERHGTIDGEKNLKEIKTWLNKLKSTSANTDKIRAAKAAFTRIIENSEYSNFIDRASGVTTKELLAYVWTGMHDSACWITELQTEWEKSDKKKIPQAIYDKFIKSLNECQRGYNMNNEEGIDDGEPDKPICVSGTFNKVMESLHTIHIDVNIEFITKDLMNINLPIRAKQAAMTYLLNLSSTVGDAIQEDEFNQLLDSLKDKGLALIWDKVRDQVLEEMAEFRFLFSVSSTDFEDNIDAAKEAVDLDEEDFTLIKSRLPRKAVVAMQC